MHRLDSYIRRPLWVHRDSYSNQASKQVYAPTKKKKKSKACLWNFSKTLTKTYLTWSEHYTYNKCVFNVTTWVTVCCFRCCTQNLFKRSSDVNKCCPKHVQTLRTEPHVLVLVARESRAHLGEGGAEKAGSIKPLHRWFWAAWFFISLMSCQITKISNLLPQVNRVTEISSCSKWLVGRQNNYNISSPWTKWIIITLVF